MTAETAAMQAGTNDPRNPGMALDAAMFEGHPVNRSAAERRAAWQDAVRRTRSA